MSLTRFDLVAYHSSAVTPDVAEALRHAESRLATYPGARLLFKGLGKPETPHLSLIPAGREVRLQLQLTSKTDPAVALGLLWGLLVPLGFTPKNRYPIVGIDDDVFHFFGPWQGLFDYLCGEGHGELAWPSVCCAAQVDVGVWDGDRGIDRFVQAQLHRLGLHCGPVDGVVTDLVTGALRALGMTGQTMEEAASTLSQLRVPPVETSERRIGHIIVPGDDLTVMAYGKIATTRTKQGVALTIDGPGRVILNIGQGET